jgi:hypothetical protein
VPPAPTQVALESSDITRGKLESWRAPVRVENLQAFDEEMFADLRRNVIEPLARGPYRYTIDSMTLASVPEGFREWTLLIGLDNGATVKVDHFVAWDEAKQSYFKDGFKRALTGLDQVRKKDAALDRYVAHWSNPRHGKKLEAIASAHLEPDLEQQRPQD